MTISRRAFLTGAGLSALAATSIATENTSTFELEHQELRSLSLPSAFDGYRIAFLTDLHLSGATPSSFITEVFKQTSTVNPHLVILGGDYTWIPESSIGRTLSNIRSDEFWNVSWQNMADEGNQRFVELTKLLSPEDGILAVMGNHDRRTSNTACQDAFLTNPGATLLINQEKLIHRGGSTISLFGVDDYLTGFPKLPAAFDARFRILIAHNPDQISEMLTEHQQPPFDFAFAGHTHGGQIRLPGLGPIALNILDRRFSEGVVSANGFTTFVSRGVGVVGLPVRVSCSPHGYLITLRKGSPQT